MRSVLTLATAALLAFAAPVPPAVAKTLVFCSDADPESLNPQVVTTVTGDDVIEQVFDGLVRFEPRSGAILPSLAESWTVSPDGRSYTFRLRRGVKFHGNARFTPTRDFDADDVLFSFDRQWREGPFHDLPGPRFTLFEDMEMGRLLEGLDRLDDHTVRFRLTRAEAPFLADLAMSFAKILSAEYAAALLSAGTPELIDREPIGTGPFRFEDYQKGMALRFRGFPEHWNGRPPLDELVFSITPNPSVRLTKLKAGECQAMIFPDPGDAGRIARDPDLTLIRQPGLNTGYLALNASRPPFDDARVRRAANMAIDKTTLVRAVYGDMGVPAKNALPPMLWSYDDGVPVYPYDPAAARRLMNDAGLADGVDVDLWYMPVTRAYNPDGRRLAEMVADDLGRIGIRAHLTTAPWADYMRQLQAGEPTASFLGWTSDNGDPDNFLGLLLGCRGGHPFANNIAKWCDPTYEALVDEAKGETDRARREALYRQAQHVFHDQAPWVPIAHGVVLSAVRKEVSGLEINLFGRYLFAVVDVVRP
jgi:dipeptide transport system substrate-binding protein